MGITYKDSGVDKNAGYEEVRRIKGFIHKTYIPGVMSDIGGFGSMFGLDLKEFPEPILVSGTDGVGTKLKVAFMMDKHDTIGEDCVAMCVNDVLCQGAKPLFFLDYIATPKLEPEKMAKIVEGVANGCIKAGCALVGGETAEMPDVYAPGEYDLAGFSVGCVNKSEIIDGKTIKEGDVIIGLASSGLHSNGFSMTRNIIFKKMGMKCDQYIDELGMTIGEEILKPTRIYTDPLWDLIQSKMIKGLSHITGGGFYENAVRMLPGEDLGIRLEKKAVPVLPIFPLLQKWGEVEEEEMYGTYNMGIGMMMAVDKKDCDRVMDMLHDHKTEGYILGQVVKGPKRVELC